MDTKEKRKEQRYRARARQRAEQDVVYTQPKPFNRNRFLLQIGTVVAAVLALLFGMSIFFKVDTVTVSGTNKYDAWTVRQASGIADGENLLTLSRARISGNILSKLPYINSVRVGIELPGTVHIQVQELDVVYAIQAQDGSWWLMSSAGKLVDTCSSADAEDYTRILGVTLSSPQTGSDGVAYQEQAATDEEGNTVPITVYASERLSVAVELTQHMEAKGLIGTVATVDVTSLTDIQMWYGTRFQMELGDSSGLERKVDALSQAVAQMDDYDTGILDASFTYWPDQVGYSPFS